MRGVTLDFSRPGKPTDSACIESLNGKFRAECLKPTGSELRRGAAKMRGLA
jgi:transposase InsO family protein